MNKAFCLMCLGLSLTILLLFVDLGEATSTTGPTTTAGTGNTAGKTDSSTPPMSVSSTPPMSVSSTTPMNHCPNASSTNVSSLWMTLFILLSVGLLGSTV
jgi:hypothetical protein